MARVTDEEWQVIYKGFNTSWFLDAVDRIDETRHYLGYGGRSNPPQIRTDFLKLHQLAKNVVNKGLIDEAQKLFDLAEDLEIQVFNIMEALEPIQHMLNKLSELYPESLLYAADWEIGNDKSPAIDL